MIIWISFILIVSFNFSNSSPTGLKWALNTIQELLLNEMDEEAGEFETINKILKKAKFGDMLEIKREGYFHWAVYIENNMVLNFQNPNFDDINFTNFYQTVDGVITKYNIFHLIANDTLRINNKIKASFGRNLEPISESEARNKVQSCFKDDVNLPFNVITNNCEHFVTHFTFGVAFSDQVTTYHKFLFNISDLDLQIEATVRLGTKFWPKLEDILRKNL